MIKGIGKQVVLLNNTESDVFEQAIFILRSGGKVPYQNMVKECERMINSHVRTKKRNVQNGWKAGFFMMLAICIVLTVTLIITLK